MESRPTGFERSIREQIRINQARTPTERIEAIGEINEALRDIMPSGPEARERRGRLRAAEERKREQLRDFLRGLLAARPGKSFNDS